MILLIPLIFFLQPIEPVVFQYTQDLRYLEQVDDSLLDSI